jgi:hypothetical protein
VVWAVSLLPYVIEAQFILGPVYIGEFVYRLFDVGSSILFRGDRVRRDERTSDERYTSQTGSLNVRHIRITS